MKEDITPFIRIWARQLSLEHGFICRRYGLGLSRPVIEIVDAASYWGKWHSSDRTITLSQTLIASQSWDVVLNVLKHEMAHQLVTEEQAGPPGHGPDFIKACQRLGLPAMFRKASSPGADMITAASGRTISATERILTRVRKLLALTDSSNEHEALLALNKARQLLHRHNLGEISGAQNGATYTNRLINLKRKRVESYHRAICGLLLDHFQTEIVITPLYDARALTTYKCLDIMGKSANVEIAGYVYHFLMERLPALWHKYQSDNCSPGSGRTSYWLGVLDGFRQGLGRKPSAGIEAKKKVPPRKTALLPAVTNDRDLTLFVASRYPKLQKSRNRATRVDLARFEAGIADGRKLQFRTGVNNNTDRQRLLEY